MGKLRLVCAYPGLGKTTLTSNRDNYLDLDFGLWRLERTEKPWVSLTQIEKEMLINRFSHFLVVKAIENPGKIILTNDLCVVERVAKFWSKHVSAFQDDCQVVMIYPADSFLPEWSLGLKRRDGDTAFYQALCANFEQWKSNWINQMANLSSSNLSRIAKINGFRCESYLTHDLLMSYFHSL